MSKSKYWYLNRCDADGNDKTVDKCDSLHEAQDKAREYRNNSDPEGIYYVSTGPRHGWEG